MHLVRSTDAPFSNFMIAELSVFVIESTTPKFVTESLNVRNQILLFAVKIEDLCKKL